MAAMAKCPVCGHGLAHVTTTVRQTSMASDISGRIVIFTCPRIDCQHVLGVTWHPDDMAAQVANMLGRS